MSYHWRDGVYFERLDNGSVLIRKNETALYEIPGSEWASIVAAVSADSETAESYEKAAELHYGKQ